MHKMTKEQNDFVYEVRVHAAESKKETGIPVSVTVAQAILESYWGKSLLAKEANNLFGIKAHGGWTGKVYVINTAEYRKGKKVVEQAAFRKYPSRKDSIFDHGRFLLRPIYSAAQPYKADPVKFAQAIHKCGYATDPFYAVKLKQVMDRYDLYRWD